MQPLINWCLKILWPINSSSSSWVSLSHKRLPHNTIFHATLYLNCCGTDTGVPLDLINVGERLSMHPWRFPMYGFPQDKAILDVDYYLVIISNNQWLINWLFVNYTLIIPWCHWCHQLVMPGYMYMHSIHTFSPLGPGSPGKPIYSEGNKNVMHALCCVNTTCSQHWNMSRINMFMQNMFPINISKGLCHRFLASLWTAKIYTVDCLLATTLIGDQL